jgi:hypothetical protein
MTNAIAQTIRQQIGTDTWLAISAREATYYGKTCLKFRFGSRYGLPKWIQVTYNPGRDDYTILAWQVHRNRCVKDLARYEGVYADSLGWLIRDINLEVEMA